MGYPHRPEEVCIVDLPPQQRLGVAGDAAPIGDSVLSGGIRVRYLYGSMADLTPFDDGSVDLVWSGESIEHVTEADAEKVVREAYRILRPGGAFCLDTPNAALTRIQSPDELIHPEHKKEYRVGEIRDLLIGAGFEVVKEKGICPMPDSLRNGVFSLKELISKRGLSDAPEEGYMFFMYGVKPLSNSDIP